MRNGYGDHIKIKRILINKVKIKTMAIVKATSTQDKNGTDSVTIVRDQSKLSANQRRIMANQRDRPYVVKKRR